jgi:hypothetical protein
MTPEQESAARREAEALAARLVGVEKDPEPLVWDDGSRMTLWGAEVAGVCVPHPGDCTVYRTSDRADAERHAKRLRFALAAALLAAHTDLLAVVGDARQDNEAYRRGWLDCREAAALVAEAVLVLRTFAGSFETNKGTIRHLAEEVRALEPPGG